MNAPLTQGKESVFTSVIGAIGAGDFTISSTISACPG